MNPLIAKEIRLLLPAYGLALLLAAVPVWLLPSEGVKTDATIVLYPFFFGAVILAVSSFGRELGLKTLPLILAQPIARNRIWWTKVAVLGVASLTVFSAWWISCEICLRTGPAASVLGQAMTVAGGTALAAFAGGLWTTLLLRQATASFWITLLVPPAIAVAIEGLGGTDGMACAAVCLYAVAGFWWAWSQFSRAQETAWTGGVVAFPARRSSVERAPGSSVRTRRPIAALLMKEFQLQQFGLAGMAGLFVLHLGAVALRKAGHNAFGEMIRAGLDFFYLFWFVAPLMVGSVSVAEERKLGTMEGILCLPVSTRIQFGIKVLFVVLGGLLAAALLCGAEGVANLAGAGTQAWEPPFGSRTLATFSLMFVAIALLAFYASTLTRNLVPALATAIATIIFFAVPLTILSYLQPIRGVVLWQGPLANFIEWPVLVGASLWLGYANFRRLAENLRLWLRNILGLMMAFGLIVFATAAIYHRAWEFLAPLEPAHGPAVFAGPKAPTLRSGNISVLTALLPDGRLWINRFSYHDGQPVVSFGEDAWFGRGGRWTSQSGTHFVEGSNWVTAAAAAKWEVAGVHSDGTLWVTQYPPEGALRLNRDKSVAVSHDRMRQVGNETNWLTVARVGGSLWTLLLKRDGSLWLWGTNHFDFKQPWPGLVSFEPRRLEEGEDWAGIVPAKRAIYAWKRDGTAWLFNQPFEHRRAVENEIAPGVLMTRWESFDNTSWRSLAHEYPFQAGVRADGTLWVWGLALHAAGEEFSERLQQVGQGADWKEVALTGWHLAGLKRDGSLWKCEFDFSLEQRSWVLSESPARFSVHSDWVALSSIDNGIVSLAADGSLWHWSDRTYDQPLLAASRRPAKIGNIFDENR